MRGGFVGLRAVQGTAAVPHPFGGTERRGNGCLRVLLEALYERYHRPEYIHPDPLEFLHRYANVRDREIVGLVAASLAYGRVSQILNSVGAVLDRMGDSPHAYVRARRRRDLQSDFAGFRHRWTTGTEIASMLMGVKRTLCRRGSLEALLLANRQHADTSILPALQGFVDELRSLAGLPRTSLLASPADGSACKRMHLYLRWMIRCDEIDPGGWNRALACLLMVPLDVHMHRLCRALGLTRRKQADGRAVREATEAFRGLAPHDPVRYDFSMTRIGIRGEKMLGALIDSGEKSGVE